MEKRPVAFQCKNHINHTNTIHFLWIHFITFELLYYIRFSLSSHKCCSMNRSKRIITFSWFGISIQFWTIGNIIVSVIRLKKKWKLVKRCRKSTKMDDGRRNGEQKMYNWVHIKKSKISRKIL